MLKTVLTSLVKPVVTVQAPMCVTMNARVQDNGDWVVHLHNAPGSLYAYPSPAYSNYLHSPGEVNPVRAIKLVLNNNSVKKAYSGLEGSNFKILADGTIEIPEINLQEVVVLEFA